MLASVAEYGHSNAELHERAYIGVAGAVNPAGLNAAGWGIHMVSEVPS